MKKICVVLPTYNERENIETILGKIFINVVGATVLVVDDNSPDGTGVAVEGLRKKYPNLFLLKRKGKEGLGKAYTEAFLHVLQKMDQEWVLMMDADLSHNPEHIPEMLKKTMSASVVVGSRYVDGGKTVGWELWRRVLSRGGNIYARIVTGLPVRDLTGGFNLMHRDVLGKIDFSDFDASGYAFIMELKRKLHKAGAKFAEVPITFRNRTGGESKISSHIISEGVVAPWRIRFKGKC